MTFSIILVKHKFYNIVSNEIVHNYGNRVTAFLKNDTIRRIIQIINYSHSTHI